MQNTIKYSGYSNNNTINSGNFYIGINDVNYGPSIDTLHYIGTGFYNTTTPPVSGYTIYKKDDNRPIPTHYVRVVENNNQAINFLKKEFGGIGNTIEELLDWSLTDDTIFVSNKNYPNIITNGSTINIDAGFTGSYGRTGNTIYDISGNKFNGTLTNGPAYSNIVGEGSIIFDGVDDYIDFGDNDEFTFSNGFTLELWVKFNQLKSQNFISKTPVGITNLSRGEFSLYMLKVSTEPIANIYGVCSDDGNGYIYSFFQDTFNTDDYYHLVMSYDGSNNQNGIDIYLNNNKKTLSRLQGGVFNSIKNTSNSLTIGRNYPYLNNFFNGNMSICRIYNYKMTDQQISDNFSAQRSRFGI